MHPKEEHKTNTLDILKGMDHLASFEILSALARQYPIGPIDNYSKNEYGDNIEKYIHERWNPRWEILYNKKLICIIDLHEGRHFTEFSVTLTVKGLWMLNIMRKRKIWK